MNFNTEVFKASMHVIKLLNDAGHKAFYAGGSVRDFVLNKTPKDFDIATSALPDEVSRLFPKTIEVGKAFGVVIVIIEDFQFEVTTFRSEGNYRDGRHPEWIKFCTHQEDISRRDFTINGMLYDPINNNLIDLVGGKQDIQNRVVRSIGDPMKRFEEDKLRMMRAIRFSCQLEFSIDNKTLEAVKILSDKIIEVSRERIRDELKHILVSNKRSLGIKLLIDSGLMQYIIPEICRMSGVEQPQEFHPEGDVLVHTLIALDILKRPSFELAMGVMLHDVGKPNTSEFFDGRIRFNGHEYVGEQIADKICRDLKFSREESDKIKFLVANHMKFKDVSNMRESTLRRFMSEQWFEDLTKLCYADVMASHKDLSPLEFIEKASEKFKQEDLMPKPLLRGQDLLDLGVSPGPVFKEILTKVEDLQLERKISEKDQAIKYVKDNWKELFSGLKNNN